jgi:2-amino-4-hydroxy-6-hydroxymethyldihydropteridine diphosphokinase
MNSAALLLGSNIEPEKNIWNAVHLLKSLSEIVRYSNVWETESVGSPGPNYLNLAIEIKTINNPNELKKNIITTIENNLGRVRTSDKNSPRTIDLDLIIFNNIVYDPDFWDRYYTAVPISDLYPDLVNNYGDKLWIVANNYLSKLLMVKRSDLIFN